MKIEVINSVPSSQRQDGMPDPFLRSGVEDVFSNPDTNVPNFCNVLRGELGVAGSAVQLCNIDRSLCVVHMHTLDSTLHLELLSVPEVYVMQSVSYM